MTALRPVRIGCSGWNYADWRGRVYPPGLPAAPLARALRDAVRHGRGQLDVLPARPARGGRALGRGDAARLPLHRQGEPLPDAHEAAAPTWSAASSASTPASRRSSSRRSSGRCCGSCPATSAATTTGSAFALERLPPGRHCFEFRHPSWFCARSTGCCTRSASALVLGDDPRRPLPPAAADRGLDLIRFHYGAPRPARQLLRDRAARRGRSGIARAARARPRCSPTSTTTGRAFAVAQRAAAASGCWRVEATATRC